mmetsp:Transcript_14451/g.14641  ORF Transcript_14451/g.14641 Transcript_14451/m.14641 type:complete len:82 (+) Transcript_14451:101-346(+)
MIQINATIIICRTKNLKQTKKSANSGRDGTRGPLRPGDLSQHERNCMRLKWLLNSLPQHRMGEALLRKKGLELPKEFRKYF